ncbi:6-bladed beta-propeller [Gemmatimonadota bacterium]
MKRLCAPLIVALLLVNCSGAEELSTAHRFNITSVDGVTVATTTGGPKYAGDLFTYEKVMEIWPDTSKAGSFLIDPGYMTMDRDGNIYILDIADNRIAVYDPDGSYLRSIGQQGHGPGDIYYPRNMFIHDDLLYVNHMPSAATLSIFRLDGSFVDSFMELTVERRERLGGSRPTLYRTSDGKMIVHMYHQRDGGHQVAFEVTSTIHSAGGDSLSGISSGPIPAVEVEEWDINGRSSFRTLDIHMTGFPWILYRPDQWLVSTDGIEPTISFYDLTGELKRTIVLEIPSEEITPEELSDLRAAYQVRVESAESSYGSSDGRTQWARFARNNFVYADPKAYWYGMYIDSNDYVWLQIPDIGGRVPHQNHQHSYRVLSPEGEYLGDTLWPVSLQPAGIGPEIVDDLLLTIVVDEETEERVPTMYRIIPIARDLDFPVSENRN